MSAKNGAYQNDNYMFYKMMKYPVPKDKELFWMTLNIKDKPKKFSISLDEFSWDEKGNIISDYVSEIDRHGTLYRSLPFVRAIYLCNSITFNALNKESDIDLFIVCKPSRIWLARFFSVIYFWILGLKRHGDDVGRKFCLSFYVTSNNLNLYNLSLKPYDIYLSYWITHLVPLYTYEEGFEQNIYAKNKWLTSLIINFPLKQSINIGNKLYIGNSLGKKIVESILGGKIGNLVEKMIKTLWKPIILYKNMKLGDKAKDVRVSDRYLKFHGQDIRPKVNRKYQIFKDGGIF